VFIVNTWPIVLKAYLRWYFIILENILVCDRHSHLPFACVSMDTPARWCWWRRRGGTCAGSGCLAAGRMTRCSSPGRGEIHVVSNHWIVFTSLGLKAASDNFWSAFCVFHAHFWEKTHSFKICALKKRNDFRQLKRSNLRVEKCKTEENKSRFLNNMAYKTVTSMRDCVMKRNYM